MANENDIIQDLFDKWVNETATEEEIGDLLTLMENFDEDWHETIPLLKKTWEKLVLEENAFDERHRGIVQSILSQFPATPANRKAPVRNFSSWRRWVAAAVTILFLGGGIYYFTDKRQHDEQPAITGKHLNIAPGRNGAVLTLADGSQVDLDTIGNGIVALQAGITAKMVNGALSYEGMGNKMVYNITSTPKGRQFHITLPDGTKVWLNSASSIRYPTVFEGNERRVEITGEAYFEVAKNNKMPFRLNIKDKAEVEVLGTHFNVNAYDNEETISTSLIEGSIKFSVLQSPSFKMLSTVSGIVLKPGQQAKMREKEGKKQPGITDSSYLKRSANEIEVINNINAGKILAWKNGFFNFENVPFGEAMRQLERWYDIDVVYEKGIPDIQFEGRMTRDIPLSGLLIALERSDVHFRLEGRKLIVLP